MIPLILSAMMLVVSSVKPSTRPEAPTTRPEDARRIAHFAQEHRLRKDDQAFHGRTVVVALALPEGEALTNNLWQTNNLLGGARLDVHYFSTPNERDESGFLTRQRPYHEDPNHVGMIHIDALPEDTAERPALEMEFSDGPDRWILEIRHHPRRDVEPIDGGFEPFEILRREDDRIILAVDGDEPFTFRYRIVPKDEAGDRED